MTREEAIAYFKRHIDLYCVDGISKESEEMAIKALEQEPCDDAISREILIHDLQELIEAWKEYPVMAKEIKGVEAALGYVKTIPPATPQPKIGRWIDRKCSRCGCRSMLGLCIENYCANCGAKIIEPQESEG
jgi:hypothetical protein